jgi:hypothetical protein
MPQRTDAVTATSPSSSSSSSSPILSSDSEESRFMLVALGRIDDRSIMTSTRKKYCGHRYLIPSSNEPRSFSWRSVCSSNRTGPVVGRSKLLLNVVDFILHLLGVFPGDDSFVVDYTGDLGGNFFLSLAFRLGPTPVEGVVALFREPVEQDCFRASLLLFSQRARRSSTRRPWGTSPLCNNPWCTRSGRSGPVWGSPHICIY